MMAQSTGAHMRSAVPEAGIKGRDKYLYPTVIVGYNYLSLPLIPAQTDIFLTH